ncbi:TIGR02300 family protein [Meridianimarinicoccus sp. RP-17]|uniref:TIGR02300 family protein n=1 Tax=Meridianimarinicoccus zhengii TaxID=2056810 RepID=UPI000DAC737F|nr:TIGR02300 family protein [Phycocomes zhengii]
MPKEEWGTKRVCPTTGKRFYDLGRNPIVSPYTGEVVTLDTGKSRTLIAEKAKPAKATDDEPVVLDDDDTAADVEIDDDLLDDDDDDDSNVSLDDLADVAADDEDS